jgi:hypothetical protein
MASKDKVIQSLRGLQEGILSIQSIIQRTKTVLLSPEVFGKEIDWAVNLWADQVEKEIPRFEIEETVVTRYRDDLRKLHSLSSKRNKRTSHQKVIKALLANFHADLVQPVMFHGETNASEEIRKIIAGIPYPDQKGYLEEALRCIEADCKRATAVLGWSAAMHHIHSKIEEIGFTEFNTEATALTKKGGRFKHFRGFAQIDSISDLREISDRGILTVLDGMGLLESNQRTRLESCLDLRIQGSHPGDAEITMPNLVSFFSDLSTLVFNNPKLKV